MGLWSKKGKRGAPELVKSEQEDESDNDIPLCVFRFFPMPPAGALT